MDPAWPGLPKFSTCPVALECPGCKQGRHTVLCSGDGGTLAGTASAGSTRPAGPGLTLSMTFLGDPLPLAPEPLRWVTGAFTAAAALLGLKAAGPHRRAALHVEQAPSDRHSAGWRGAGGPRGRALLGPLCPQLLGIHRESTHIAWAGSPRHAHMQGAWPPCAAVAWDGRARGSPCPSLETGRARGGRGPCLRVWS